MSEPDDRSIDHELSGVAMAAVYEHEQTVSEVETDAALDAVRSRATAGDLGGAPPSIPLTSSPAGGRSAWVRFGAVAAAVSMVALGLVAVIGDRTSDDVIVPTREPENAPGAPVATTVPASPASTVAVDASTDAEAVTPPATIAIDDGGSAFAGQTLRVDAFDPPRLVEPVPYFTLPFEPDPDGDGVEFAVGPDHVVINQRSTNTLTIVGDDGDGVAARIVDVEEGLSSIVAGPGQVVYGVGDPVFDGDEQAVPSGLRFVAVSTLGANEGGVVAVEEVDLNAYLELPPYFFGHGPEGVVERGRDNATIADYVDEDGQPLGVSAATPFPSFDFKTGTESPTPPERNTITVQGAEFGWQIEVTRDPGWQPTYLGRNVVAPGLDRAIYAERIGADTTPEQDFGDNLMPVVALLNYDGSGEWIRLPDDWDVVASDVWGTLLARLTADSIELASLDDLVPPTGPPAPVVDSAEGSPAVTSTLPDLIPGTGPDNGLTQPSAIERSCVDDSTGCTQLASTENGRIVGFDPSDSTLRVYDAAGTELQAEVPIAEPIELAYLWAIGPDDVAYLGTPTPGASDPSDDLVAIPLVGSNAGSIVMRWTGLDGSGDSTLIPRKTGLTTVGCCGPAVTRPSPDATIYRWVDRNGVTIESDRPSFDLNLGDAGNSLTRIDTLADGSATFTPFSLPTIFQYPRDFPYVVPTDDAGAVAFDFAQWSELVEVLVDFDVDWPENGIDNSDVYYRRPGDYLASVLIEPGGTVVAGFEDRFERLTLDQAGERGWGGTIDIDRTAAVWEIDASGLNGYVEAEQPFWASIPDLYALQFKQFVGPNESVTVDYDEASTSLSITTTGFLDDSVAGERWTIDVEVGADGLFRFVSGSAAISCQPGRGHQDFSTELCV